MGNHDRVGAGGIDHTEASWRFAPGLSDTKPTFPPHHIASRSLFLTMGMITHPTNSKPLHLIIIMVIPMIGATEQTQLAGPSPTS